MQTPKTWAPLFENYEHLKSTHLRELLKDEKRNDQLLVKHSDIILDLSH
jgi:hypothetical protein